MFDSSALMRPGSPAVWAAALLLWVVTGCYRPAWYLEYDAQQNRMLKVPEYAGTGDQLFLIVRDSGYGNRYLPKFDTFAVVVAERAAVFGAIDLSKLTAGF
ncbi:MAG: hypothetical protein ABR543_13090, partial [Gemmatimonadaceae bacterium]